MSKWDRDNSEDAIIMLAIVIVSALIIFACGCERWVDPAIDLSGSATAERGADTNHVHHADINTEGSLHLGL